MFNCNCQRLCAHTSFSLIDMIAIKHLLLNIWKEKKTYKKTKKTNINIPTFHFVAFNYFECSEMFVFDCNQQYLSLSFPPFQFICSHLTAWCLRIEYRHLFSFVFKDNFLNSVSYTLAASVPLSFHFPSVVLVGILSFSLSLILNIPWTNIFTMCQASLQVSLPIKKRNNSTPIHWV